jgi:hypothetical protein
MKRLAIGLVIGLILSFGIGAGVWALSVGLDFKTGPSNSALSRFCEYLHASPIGMGIRESVWVFPILEGTHLLGIALSVGVLCWFDLRLLGLVLTDEPVEKVWNSVMPVALVGFVLMFITGIFLFWAEARTAFHSVHFWIKIALLVIVGINALVFELTSHSKMHDWQNAAAVPMRARMAGVISLVLWAAIIITGRTMAYSF